MQAAKIRKSIGILLAATTLAGVAWPGVVAARGGSRDPIVQAERQRRRTEEHKSKRREQLEEAGAAVRDSKKSSQDSRQNEMQNELGLPNVQSDRWK